jgi:hypothetical protein
MSDTLEVLEEEELPEEDDELELCFRLVAISVLCLSRYFREACFSASVDFPSEFSLALCLAAARFFESSARASVRAPSSFDTAAFNLTTRCFAELTEELDLGVGLDLETWNEELA